MNASKGRRIAALSILPMALTAIALAGCEQVSEYYGGAEGPGDCSDAACAARVDADNLCTWRHITRYNDPRIGEQGSGRNVVLCDHRRQVYATCNINVVSYEAGSVGQDRTHGTQACEAYYAPPTQIRVLGSIAEIWLRLDNPDRAWKRGFGEAQYCNIYENDDSQSILYCQSRNGIAE
jgi:hypothetical protein